MPKGYWCRSLARCETNMTAFKPSPATIATGRILVCAAAAFCLLATAPLRAATGGSISGTIADPSSAVIAGASPTLADRGYKNRSEALRDLMRESLVSQAVDKNQTMVATLTMVYDHHLPNLANQLIDIQHHAHGKVLAATHVHLDDDYCLEVIIMKGRSREIQSLADGMLSLRGVKHGKLVLTDTGKK